MWFNISSPPPKPRELYGERPQPRGEIKGSLFFIRSLCDSFSAEWPLAMCSLQGTIISLKGNHMTLLFFWRCPLFGGRGSLTPVWETTLKPKCPTLPMRSCYQGLLAPYEGNYLSLLLIKTPTHQKAKYSIGEGDWEESQRMYAFGPLIDFGAQQAI